MMRSEKKKKDGQIILDVGSKIKVFDPKKFGNPLQGLSRELEWIYLHLRRNSACL